MKNCPNCNTRLNDSNDRAYLKVMVGLLTPGQQQKFKRMYSEQDTSRSIDTIIDNMPTERLATLEKQIKNTSSSVKHS